MVIRKLLGLVDRAASRRQDKLPEPVVYKPGQHPIQSSHLDAAALQVVKRLVDAGFDTYIVGGAVRDLIIGRPFKDVDVSTSASPRQVVKLFRRARVIGKRFPIVHVREGRSLIEVTTFRALHDQEYEDIAIGSVAEDAMRRDIGINALYYNPLTNEVLDWCGGMEDLREGVVRIVGSTEQKLSEDPVRILRALRYCARLDFKLDPELEKAIPKFVPRLKEVSAGRLALEKEKDFVSEMNAANLRNWKKYGLADFVSPSLTEWLDRLDAKGLEIYEKTCDLVRANDRMDDRDAIMRIMLLGIASIDVPMAQRLERKILMEQWDRVLNPLFTGLEIARWKRPIAQRALFGQFELDRQLSQGNLSRRNAGKDYYGHSLRLAMIRCMLAGDREEDLAMLRKQLQLHRGARKARMAEGDPEAGGGEARRDRRGDEDGERKRKPRRRRPRSRSGPKKGNPSGGSRPVAEKS